MSGDTFKPGDVLDYTPEQRHCREGTALVHDHGRAHDTFWGSGSDQHALTSAELATAKLSFNVADYHELDRDRPSVSRGAWKKYSPDDRRRITSQHGLQERLFIRRGATPSLATQIRNAEVAVAEADSAVRSAQSTLDWRRGELATLREKAGV